MKVCKICRINKATIPDREETGKPIKEICKECHTARLRNDLKNIYNIYNKYNYSKGGLK